MATASLPQAVRTTTHRNPAVALLRGIGIFIDTSLRVLLLGREGIDSM